MRRRRGGGAAPAEACGVWLDTAELKRGRARPLRLGAPGPAAGRRQNRALPAQPGSRERSSPWQSSILSFVSPMPDDKDKENRRPAAPWEDCRVKILPLPQLEGAQEEPPGAGQGLQGTARAAQTPLEPQVGSQGLSKASPGAGGPSWGRGSSKPRVCPAGTAPGGRRAVPCGWAGDTNPAPGGRRAVPCGWAGAGGTNPAPGAAPSGVCCSPQSPGPAQPLRERGQVPAGPCRESQGSRDRDRDSPDRDSPIRTTPSPIRTTPSPTRTIPSPTWATPSPTRTISSPIKTTPSPTWTIPSPTWTIPSPTWTIPSPTRTIPSPTWTTPSPTRTIPSPTRTIPSPTWTTPSPPRAPQPPELGSEPLFTQDSEGNRVIKHW